MKMIRLIPSPRAIGLFPKNPITGEPALDMDPTEVRIPLSVGKTFTFNNRSLVITQLGKQQSSDGKEYILVWVDLA